MRITQQRSKQPYSKKMYGLCYQVPSTCCAATAYHRLSHTFFVSSSLTRLAYSADATVDCSCDTLHAARPLMAAAAVVAPAAPMSRLTEQRGYSWPPTPPRWARDEHRAATNTATAQPRDQHDVPIILSDSDSDSDEDDDADHDTPPSNQPSSSHDQRPASRGREGQAKEERDGRDEPDAAMRDSCSSSDSPFSGEPKIARRRASASDRTDRSADRRREGQEGQAASSDGREDNEGDEDDEEEEEEEEEEDEKAHDSEETEDEASVAMEEAAASGSIVQDVRDVQHEDFSASQRELQEEAAVAAAVSAEAERSDVQSKADAAAEAEGQQREKRRHDSINGATELPANKQVKAEALLTIAESKHDIDDELMIDELRTKVSVSSSSSPTPAAITPITHTYFASSSPEALSLQQLLTGTQSSCSTSTAVSHSTTPASVPSSTATAHTQLTRPPQPALPPVLKLLSSFTHHMHNDKPPLTLHLSPQTTFFYYDPDTCSHPPNAKPQPIGHTTKQGRSRLAAWQLLQRQDELEEELAAADEAMEKDEQAGKEVAEKWERKIDALQEEMDEIEDELEAREGAERERERRELDAWYTYSRLGATEEEVKKMDEEDAKAAAELGYDDSDGSGDDSEEESAEEEEGGDDQESKEGPPPTSPPTNPFEQAASEQPAAHFKNALNEWQEYYHVDDAEFKRATEAVWAQGGFVSGLYFEKGRKEEGKGARQAERKEQRTVDANEETKAEGTEYKKEAQQRNADSEESVANKENAPPADSSPKFSPPAPVPAPPAISHPPVRSSKATKPPPASSATSLFSASVSPPLAPSAAAHHSITVPALKTSSPSVESRPVVKSPAISSFFSSPSSSSSSSSSVSSSFLSTSASSSSVVQGTSSRRVMKPQLIGSHSSKPANLVANGGLPSIKPSKAPSARREPADDDMIDLTDD